MNIDLVAQPYRSYPSLYQLLGDASDDPDVFQVDIVVAWARRSGLGPLRAAFSGMRKRNVTIRMIVGIDAGGASRQGLAMTREFATEAYVFHFPGNRTFHPKLYVIRGKKKVQVLIGSQNLTRGGSVENFELGTLIELDQGLAEDRSFLADIDSYIDGLLEDKEICRSLDSALLAYLLSDKSRIELMDEERAGFDTSKGRPLIDREEVVFGISRNALTSLNAPGSGLLFPDGNIDRPHRLSDPSSGSIEQRWYKTVRKSDAQRLSGSNPSGHMTLTRSGHPIDPASYFREVLFGKQEWREEGGGREYTWVNFEVEILGHELGRHPLIVDFNPAFESEQGNRTSTLRWGDVIGRALRNDFNITDCFVSIEKMQSGIFRLRVSESQPGDFLWPNS